MVWEFAVDISKMLLQDSKLQTFYEVKLYTAAAC